MKIHLTSFASLDIKASAIRFKDQAREMNVYDKINIFTENDLNQDFKDYVFSLLKKGKKKGFGYWVWQTYLHKLVMSEMEEGDIYHWCDVGCHFNINGITRLKEYIAMVSDNSNGVLGFQYKDPEFKYKCKNYVFPNYMEYQYTKADLIKFFGLNNEDKIIKSPQIWGGSFFLKKCKISTEIMQQHYDITRNRFDLIDDDEKKFIEKNVPSFIQHRHSQSVLSILFKKYNCQVLSAYESEWAYDTNKNRTYEHLKQYPIIAKRDKKKKFFTRFIDRQKKTLNRIKKKLIFKN